VSSNKPSGTINTALSQRSSSTIDDRILLGTLLKSDSSSQRYAIEARSYILPELPNGLPEGSLGSMTYSQCIEWLLTAGTTPLDQAAAAAKILHAKDPRFFLATLETLCSAPEEGIEDRMCRGLELLDKLGYYDNLLPWLRVLSQHRNERVRSKAIKLLCKAVPHRPLIEQHLKSPDSRIRANAIEALWFHQSPESKAIFHSALSDPSHRVVVNALIGLCHQNDEAAWQKLIALSQHPSELFRAAVIWAFAHLYDDRAIEPLKALANDPSEIIRKKACHALARILYVQEWTPLQGLA
jgi:HEAT repeat protein